jgi:hypothetical protein
MELMNQTIRDLLPRLYETEEVSADLKPVPVKYFTPDSSWTWYGLEYGPEDRLFFGFVVSHLCPEGELGYFSLDELEQGRGPLGMPIERDLWWKPTTTLETVMESHRGPPLTDEELEYNAHPGL